LYATRRIGRPKRRLEDVTADLRRMGIKGWMEKARNRDQWRRIVEETKAHPGRSAEKKKPASKIKCGIFLSLLPQF
jgi:hypothetical protein